MGRLIFSTSLINCNKIAVSVFHFVVSYVRYCYLSYTVSDELQYFH